MHRLSTYRRPEQIVRKLLLDSLLFLKVLPPRAIKLLDFGSGAGIPGIPLKIVSPQIVLTLVEAQRRRSSFLATVLRDLELDDVTLVHGRAEQVLKEGPEFVGAFDAVLLRAAGSLETVIPAALCFLRHEGFCIASGPPAGKTNPIAFKGAVARWHSTTSPISRSPRQFLLVQKMS